MVYLRVIFVISLFISSIPLYGFPYIRQTIDTAVLDLAWSPSGGQYAIAYRDGTIAIYNLDGDLSLNIFAHSLPENVRSSGNVAYAGAIAWSPDGTLLATSGSDNLVKIWQTETGELVAELSGHIDAYLLSWSPDGTRFISNSINNTRLWNSQTWEYIDTLPWATVADFEWRSDGTELAVGTTNNLLLVDNDTIGSLEEIQVLEEITGQVYEVAWLPDGMRLITTSQDRIVRIWDMESGTILSLLGEYEGDPYEAAVSPDGRYIAFNSVNENYTDETVNSTLRTFA